MVERYIPGRELTCAVIGDFVTDVIEIVPLKGLAFYDYEAKYAAGGSKHVLPAKFYRMFTNRSGNITLRAPAGAWAVVARRGRTFATTTRPTGRAS